MFTRTSACSIRSLGRIVHSTIISITAQSVEKQGKSALGCAIDRIRNENNFNCKWLGENIKLAVSTDQVYKKMQKIAK